MSAQRRFVPVHGASCVFGLTFFQAGCAVMKIWDMEKEYGEVRIGGSRSKVNTLV